MNNKLLNKIVKGIESCHTCHAGYQQGEWGICNGCGLINHRHLEGSSRGLVVAKFAFPVW